MFGEDKQMNCKMQQIFSIFALQHGVRNGRRKLRNVSNSIINCDHLVKTYGKFTALSDLCVDIPQGEIFGLLGPNGAGKTTTIRIINKIIRQDSGKVYFNGNEMTEEDVRKIGYMPEERGLYRKMKVGEQCIFFARLKGMSKSDAVTELHKWFKKFGIQSWWNKKVEDLSKGMPEGAVRVYDIYSIFPFNNTVIVAKMTGKQLKELVEDITANGKIQPMSGVRMTVAGRKIVNLTVGGKPVDETATYYLATIDFLYGGGDRIFVSRHCESFESTSLFIRDALIDYIDGLTAEGKMIATKKDGRVKVIKNVSELDLDE